MKTQLRIHPLFGNLCLSLWMITITHRGGLFLTLMEMESPLITPAVIMSLNSRVVVNSVCVNPDEWSGFIFSIHFVRCTQKTTISVWQVSIFRHYRYRRLHPISHTFQLWEAPIFYIDFAVGTHY